MPGSAKSQSQYAGLEKLLNELVGLMRLDFELQAIGGPQDSVFEIAFQQKVFLDFVLDEQM